MKKFYEVKINELSKYTDAINFVGSDLKDKKTETLYFKKITLADLTDEESESIFAVRDLIAKKHKIIQVFNLEGVLLLEARNATILNKLVCIPQGTISQQLSKGVQRIPKGEFLIKYKEEEVDL